MSLMAEILLEDLAATHRELNTTFEGVKSNFGPVDKLAPTLSKKNVELHLNALTKGYFTKFAETNSAFTYRGARLHEIWWEQFNGEQGDIEAVSKSLGFTSSSTLIEAILEVAGDIEGNGWVVVTNGGISFCLNHSWESDFNSIVLLIDMWEHAYQTDYGSDKKKYIETLLTDGITWSVVSDRM